MKDKKELFITGGTGSLSKAILKKISESKHNLKGIRLFSRDEFKQNNLKNSIKEMNLPPVAFIIGDIRDYRRLEEALNGVNLVIHTAALKHVPIAEENPLEYIQTNVMGTQNLLRTCIKNKVEKAVFVSTDKAAEPTTLYGATKLCGEKLWLRGAIYTGGHGTEFAAVRYGNVIGSRGSILDVINKKKRIPVTNPKMTRFWIPLPKVAGFVLSVLEDMQPGHLYVPKMVSCSLRTFLKATTGTTEDDWDIVGKRAGEKMHEMLVTQDEYYRTTETNDRYIICPDGVAFWEAALNEPLHSDNRNPLYTDLIEDIENLIK